MSGFENDHQDMSMIQKLMIAEERHGALERQALSSNVTEFAESLEDQLTRAMAEIVERGRQV